MAPEILGSMITGYAGATRARRHGRTRLSSKEARAATVLRQAFTALAKGKLRKSSASNARSSARRGGNIDAGECSPTPYQLRLVG